MEQYTVDYLKEKRTLPHIWSKCIGAGRACEGLRADWQKHLKLTIAECGFEYIRFHGLLAEDMFVCREVDGVMHYNWYYIDALYDFLIESGIRPIAEFGFMPPALASGDKTQFWWKGNITPPKDYKKWEELIRNLVGHWKERYGLEEIRRWYYEVWNEADLSVFWSGTKTQYFELYKAAVRAVKSVDEKLRVGGPATSNYVPDDRFAGELEDVTRQVTHMVEDINTLEWKGVWIEDFLTYCEKEGLPVDFVSTHPYPTDFALDGQQEMKGRSRKKDSVYEDVCWLHQVVKKSAYPNAEIHLTEWNSSPSSRDYAHDFLPAADYIIRSNLLCAGLTDSLSYWGFTDIFEEEGGGPESFHGGFGLMNRNGIRKPAYHAYRFLHALGTQEVKRWENGIASCDEKGKASLLFWNEAPELKQAVPISSYPDHSTAERIQAMGETRKIRIQAENVHPNAVFQVEILDKEHTAAEKWIEMGCPENLSRGQEQCLKETVPLQKLVKADGTGRLSCSFEMKPWAVLLVREL